MPSILDATMEPQPTSKSKLEDGVRRFLDEYFRLSDIRERTPEYVNMFTEDAAFTLDSQSYKGSAEITAAMEALWATITWRKHTIRDASPYGNNPGQVEIQGSVDLGLLDGQKKTLDFTSRGHLTRAETEWGYKWDSYQVFIDLSALA